MTRRSAGTIIAAIVGVLSGALAGCSTDPAKGYSFQSTFAADARSVSVPVFDNATYTPGIEGELTEALVKEIQRSSPMRVVQGPAADTQLIGVITRSDLRRISRDSQTGLVQEMAVEMAVDFEWRDNRTGKTLVARRNFSAVDTFVPQRLSGERIEVGQRGAIQQLARDIVGEMRGGW